MKITNIEKTGGIYTVTFTPNWIERRFGVKTRIENFKLLGINLLGGNIYVRKDGKRFSLDKLSDKIDMWEDSF